MIAWLSQYQACADHEGPEELPYGYVETERRLLHYRIATIQLVGILHPAKPVGQRRMSVAGALGSSGRARGVDHVGEILSGDGHLRIGRIEAPQPLAVGRQHQRLHLRRHRQAIQQMRLGQQQPDTTVLQHVGKTLLRILRIQRHVGAAGLENSHQGDHQFHRALHRNAYQRFRPDTPRYQGMRQTIGAAVQLAITEALFTEHQRRRLR